MVTSNFYHIRSRLMTSPPGTSPEGDLVHRSLSVRAVFTFILARHLGFSSWGRRLVGPAERIRSPTRSIELGTEFLFLGRGGGDSLATAWGDGRMGVSVSGSLHMIFWTLENY